MRRKVTILILFLCVANALRAAAPIPFYIPRDFAAELSKTTFGIEPHGTSFWNQPAVNVGFGLMASGALVGFADSGIRSIRNNYIPSFRYRYDDHLVYASALIMLGMKTFGVESRSSWGEMLTADAFSAAVMFASVYGLKYGIARMRPDSSARNSFPSGHTAMAFMTATMLHMEYGHLSPWVSVGAYSLATVTGISRMLNNRHWLSDVVVGAGIGILSTRVGYLISDAIFKKDNYYRFPDDVEFAPRAGNPSFVSVRVNTNFIPLPSDAHRIADSGAGVGVEGAWFLTPTFGLGASFDINRFAAYAAVESIDRQSAVNNAMFTAGAYFARELSSRWQLGGKAAVGFSKNRSDVIGVDESTQLTFDNSVRPSATAGISLRFLATRNFGVRLFGNLNAVAQYSTLASGSQTTVNKSYSFPVSIGLAVDAILW